MKKKIGIVIDNIERIFSSQVKGGGDMVAKNIILELLDRDDIDLLVFSENCDFSKLELPLQIINVPHFLKEYTDEIDKIVSAGNFDKVISLNIAYPYKNYIIQSQSYKQRCASMPLGSKLVKRFLSRKKIQTQNERYNHAESKYIAVSKSVKEDYVENLGLNLQDVKVVYPATKSFYDEYPQIKQNKNIKFGTVAGHSINKGGHLFLLALGMLKLAGCKFSAQIVAPKWKKDILFTILIGLFGMKSQVEFLPRQVDMQAFYDSIDCLVLPSKNEAFGLVAIEAMACGKPCLISSTTGISEIIESETSFVYDRKSFSAYVKALKSICRMYDKDFCLYEKYSKNAFNLSKKYNWKNFVDQLIEV